ncbi:sigma-54 dependent transcriptional regulator [Sporolactobacillus sp. CQH2019]|uniref:sigma-54 interaction domain-containing protein n=1 Tax=Sporolactobacillus sp. CQH2019 TaxID=3023512 RepID=UPI002368097A|nr:sigma-54 dependent transcriptional regulator [Sporolactobacillus sp. CQH2019]MDD9146965.1 sigma-54 dependent transcriptional regulator [Sporolactobacillus sp. CQH2019]
MTYESDNILTAWRTFIGKGKLLKENIRPEVARSWLRCRQLNVDPWSSDFPSFSEERLIQVKKGHTDLLEMAHPVILYLLAIFKCNISICDEKGFVFELKTPLDAYPRTYGTQIEEKTCGNGSITVTLNEKKPFRLEGFEHYRTVSQDYSGVSAPIFTQHQMTAVLTMTNPFYSLPEHALICCIEGAKIISKLLNNVQERHLLSTANLFSGIINAHPQPILILDKVGNILTANTAGEKIVWHYTIENYGRENIARYLVHKEDIHWILDDEAMSQPRMIYFRNRSKVTEYQVVEKRTIYLPNGLEHHLVCLGINQPDNLKTNKKKIILRDNSPIIDYVGVSKPWKKIDAVVHKIAKYNTNVLLLGETGTGKEVVARAIHRLSGRSGPFVAINCGAIPKELFASELFGYESGAFTGAKTGGAIGKFEYADQGTLFLDEIGEMPLEIQVSFLRVIQEKTLMRIGSNTNRTCDVRLIAATNQNLRAAVQTGKFRSDLFYRLSVVELELPLLKERRSDIPLLTEYFINMLSNQLHISYRPISNQVIDALAGYSWPGNVRELKNVVEKMLIFSDEKPITMDLLPEYIRNEISTPKHLPPIRSEGFRSESDQISALLEQCQGNLSQAARQLGVGRNTLYRKIKKYNIEMHTSVVKKD